MRIYVRVTPRASKNEVAKIGSEEYKIKVTAPPEKGRANDVVVNLLADHFGVPKSSVSIAGGKSARIKIVDIAV